VNDFTVTVAIDRPPADVLEFMAEPGNMVLWCDAVQRTVTTSLAVRQCCTFEMVRVLPGAKATNQVEIVEYEP
jgi:hypothetical protein